MHLFCLIFDEYETLDLMGPVEFLARVPEVKISYVSFDGGMKRSKQGFFIKTKKLLIPVSFILCKTLQRCRN